MKRLWAWIADPANQKTLAFLGSGLVAVVVAGWALYGEFYKSSPSPKQVVENACSGDVCTFGISLAEYQEALARQEEALRAELASTSGENGRVLALEQDLESVRKRLENVEAAFAQRSAGFTELARSLEEGPIDAALAERFKETVASGDTAALETRLREEADRDLARGAARAYQLGLLLVQDGRMAEAYEALQRAATLTPENTTYQAELARVSDQLDVLLGAGTLRVRAVLAEGGEPVNARHEVHDPEPGLDGNRARRDYNDGAAVIFELPAGTYWVTSRADLAEAGQEVQVAAARNQDVLIDLNAGRLRLSALLSTDGAPVNATFSIFHPEQDLDGNRKRIDYRNGEASWFTLPAGTYWVTAQSDHALTEQILEVVAGEDRAAVIDLHAGRLRVSAVLSTDGAPVNATYSIFHPQQDLDGNRKRIDYRNGEASWFTLPAGTYYVQAEADDLRVGREVQVPAGRDTEIVIDLGGGP